MGGGEEEGGMGSREEEVRQDGCGFVGALFRRWYRCMNV